jgi:hypothetical protein
MNYIWDLVIRAFQNGIPQAKLRFVPAKSYSPYMELSQADLNFTQVEQEIEINPYYRFYEIFKDLFNINNHEDQELRRVLLDVTIHFLTGIDLRQGMNKTEYYLRFIQREIAAGVFGAAVQKDFDLFSPAEQGALAKNIYRLLITGELLYLLKDTVRQIFTNSTIYVNYETTNELLFFINYEKTAINLAKLNLINELFLPLQFKTIIYWKDHFGVIGADETMQIDHIALY